MDVFLDDYKTAFMCQDINTKKSVFWTFLWKLNPFRGWQYFSRVDFKVQCTSTTHRALNNQHKVALSPRWQKSTKTENVEASSQSCYNVLHQIWCVGARKVLIRAFCLFPLHSSVSQPIKLSHTWLVVIMPLVPGTAIPNIIKISTKV